MFFLMACQQNDLFPNTTITAIIIQDWDTAEAISNITNAEHISDLVEALEAANYTATADLDIPKPDYRLLFLTNGSIVREFG